MTIRRAVMRDSSFENGPTDRQVRMVCSTQTVGRDNLVLVSSGIDLANYRLNPIWLWQHDANSPVARSIEIDVDPQGRLVALVEFPPAGVSPKADEICGLIKAGTLRAASTGFDDMAAEPVEPGNPSAGIRVTRAELLEMSFVSIGAVPDALVDSTMRSLPNGEIIRWLTREIGDAVRASLGYAPQWTACGSQSLPVDESAAWIAEDAVARVFAAADWEGDSPDVGMVQRAFAAFDASAPLIKRSYTLPFADMIDGELRAVRSGIASVAAKLDVADLPETVKTGIRSLVAAYAPQETRAMQSHIKRSIIRRGLYDVGCLAGVMSDLGAIHGWAQWEAEAEGDGSKVPSMIAEGLRVLADALMAMTEEEVAEMLAALPGPVATAGLTEGQSAIITQSTSPALARFWAGVYRTRNIAAAGAPVVRTPARERKRRQRESLLLGVR